jgi:hypothetical protein
MFPSCYCRWQHGREKLKAAFALVDAGLSPTKAAFQVGIGRSTLYEALAQRGS